MEKAERKMRQIRLPKLKIRLPNLKFIDEILPFALLVLCILAARFIESELTVFLIYIAALIIYVWRRYDARMFVETAIFLLIACAVILASGYEKYANQVAVWAYYFLVVGVIGLFIDYLREGKNDKKNDEEKNINSR